MTELKLFGAFRTGSNLVRALLELNYNVLVHNNTYAYKHIPVPAYFEDNQYSPFATNIVSTVKDPFAFIDSVFRYCKKTNYLNIEAGDTFEEFCVQPFTVFDGAFENFPRYRFANPAQYWNSMYTNLRSIPDRSIILLRYEDLLTDMQGTIESVREKYKLEKKSDSFSTPEGITINLGDPSRSKASDYYSDQPFERNQYYLQRDYMERFTRSQIQFIYSELDSELLDFFSYSNLESPFVSNGRKAPNLYKLLSTKSKNEESLAHKGSLLRAQEDLSFFQEKCFQLTTEARSLEKELASLKASEQETEARAQHAEAVAQEARGRASDLESKLAYSLESEQVVCSQLAEKSLSLESHQRYATGLRTDLDVAKKNYQAISESVSYKLGYDLIHAIIRPGKNTILFPFRLFRHISPRGSQPTSKQIQKGQRPQEAITNGDAAHIKQPKLASELNVACIFDQFTIEGYKHECNLMPVPLEGWEELFEKTTPDLFFVESAWRGNGGVWEYKIGTYAGQDRSELASIIHWCNDHNVPTVFWNKEDPVNYDKFIDAARRFDVIFTTDIDMLPKYRQASGHEHVYPLIFSAQPQLHNPIRSYPSEEKACFAGTYYRNVYEERKQEMDEILDIAQNYGLVIYDRNYLRNQAGENEFTFPERFQKDILGSLDYAEMDRAYKGYRFTLNVNSIKRSPTMFSRRVFESLACGTPVLSTPSLGVEQVFGDLIIMTGDKIEPESILSLLRCNDFEYQKRALKGIREVFSQHLYRHRFAEILSRCRIEVIPTPEPDVTMIAMVENETEIEQAIVSFNCQIWNRKRLLLLVNKSDRVEKQINQYKSKYITLHHLHSAEVLDYALSDLIDTQFVSFTKPRHYYGPNFLTDLMQASLYTEAQVIGKAARYEASGQEVTLTEGPLYRYVEEPLNPISAITSSASVADVGVSQIRAILEEEKFTGDVLGLSTQFFSVNSWNFIASARGVEFQLELEQLEYVSI